MDVRNKAGFQFLVSLFFLHSPTIFESKCNATNTFQEGSSCTHTLFRPFRPCLWRQDFNLAFKNIVIVRLRNVDIHVFQWILIIEQIKIKNRSCKTLPRGAVLLCKVRFQWTQICTHRCLRYSLHVQMNTNRAEYIRRLRWHVPGSKQ